MLGFARNSLFFGVNGGSVAEKSWLACATVAGIPALQLNPARLARTGCDWGFRSLFLFFADAVLLRFARQSGQIAVEWLCQGLSKGRCSSEIWCDCIMFCKLLSTDRSRTVTSWIWLECSNLREILRFLGKRMLHCEEKLAGLRDGCGHPRFAVKFGLMRARIICLSVCLPVSVSIGSLPLCLSDYLAIWLFIYLSICLSVYLSACLSVYLFPLLSLLPSM